MKTLNYYFACFLFFVLLITTNSCTKSDRSTHHSSNASTTDAIQEIASTSSSNAAQNTLSYCSPDSVTLCWKKSNLTPGKLVLKRGSDNNMYVTFKADPGYYFMQVNLYCGLSTLVPNLLNNFPYKMLFSSPYPNSEYTFVLNNLPSTFTVVGYAVVVKKSNNGNITGDIKELWANGCSGQPVCNLLQGLTCGDLSNGSFFNYSSAGCFPAAAVVEAAEPDICSQPVCNFFGVHAVYGTVVGWVYPSVTVAGFDYTEEEARAIYNSPDVTGVIADSKYAFSSVATLKLSNTQYSLSPTLTAAVTTIETWLTVQGKLSPTHLPTGNSAVRTAAETIYTWINGHNCPERRK